jgi:hypothetical protein
MSHITLGRCVGRIDPRGELLFTVVAKETFRIVGSSLVASEEPEPILEGEDPICRRSGPGGREVPVRLPDLVPDKLAPDLVVLATARRSPAATRGVVRLQVGGREQATLQLVGPRQATWFGGGWEVSDPEPWEALPLYWDHAYGGTDGAPAPAGEEDAHEALSYPRNDLGTGFLTAEATRWPEALRLPCVERPDDLLTPERLVCLAAARWHRQPRPAGFGWIAPHWFPRSIHLGLLAGPWPDLGAGPTAEEDEGTLPAGLLEQLLRCEDAEELIRPQFFQEASPGLSIPGLERVATISLKGIDGEGTTHLDLPSRRPRVVVTLGRRSIAPPVKLLTLLLDLDAGVALRIWGAALPLTAPELRGLGDDDLESLPVGVSCA